MNEVDLKVSIVAMKFNHKTDPMSAITSGEVWLNQTTTVGLEMNQV
jgi:hypothetical protein